MVNLKSVTTIGGTTFRVGDPLAGTLKVSEIVLNVDDSGIPTYVSIWKSEGGVIKDTTNYPHGSIPYHAVNLMLFNN